MGGMQGYGPVAPEAREPWFHAPWERRAFALTLAMGATGQWNLDQVRAARESLPPAHYLASSYYQIWLAALGRLMVERGLVTPEEIADGRMRQAPFPIAPILAAERVAPVLAGGSATVRPATAPARFAIGDAVRARVMNPRSHTRLPRYCRGKPGVITKVHGTHVFPDTNARGEGEQPQWLYSVRFDARELWGADTTAAAVHVDCWDPYLEAR
jgi:nitrile hydratase